MDQKFANPLLTKSSQTIVFIIGLMFILYIGQEIIVPLIFSLILAILLNPLVNFLVRIRFNRILAISITVLLAIFVAFGLLIFIGSQLISFGEELPQLKQNFNEMLKDVVHWLSQNLNVSTLKINKWIDLKKSEGIEASSAAIGSTIGTISSYMVVMFLLPVYIFLILLYKPLLLDFLDKSFPASDNVDHVLIKTKSLIQNYLIGLLIEAGIVATLNTAGLLILGIEYALLIGIIGALLNLIPYIGGLVAIALPMLIALATKEPIFALYVFILYIIVQLIDNNFIVPKIVASKVKINALASIVVVLIGGAMWGVAGMFLAIPLTAICKVIFDRVDSLKPLGLLIGDTMPDFNFLPVITRKKITLGRKK